MKKVLVTGGAGSIGKKVISYLLSESKYDITVLELENNNNLKYLKKYNNRVNIVYGDTCDYDQISFLIRNQDVVIHLAGIMPIVSEYSLLHKTINIDGTFNIINAIKKENPKCHLLYLSTTALYDNNLKQVKVSSKLSKEIECNYVRDSLNIENEIKKKLANYTIYRSSAVLSDDNFIDILNCLNNKREVEVISVNDVAYALSKSLDYLKNLNRKIYNLGGGKNCQTTYDELCKNIYLNYGISYKRFKGILINKKCLNSYYVEDSDKLNEILNYQSESINIIYRRIRKKYSKKKMQIFIAKILLRMRLCLKK